MSPLYAALVHHPVKARDGSTITTAVTNLDVHDLARLARTYGLAGYFVVTPVTAQRELVLSILAHWREGSSGKRIPERAEALETVRVAASLEEARAEIAVAHGGEGARVVATAARAPEGVATSSFAEEARRLRERVGPTLLVFGTGHGLADAVLRTADALLPPIRPGGFNHLSVRAAAAITLDRLVSEA